MTPAEEDALVEQVRYIGITEGGEPVRLAIRAAYAKGQEVERERCARVCEMVAGQYTSNHFGSVAKNCATAIRKGE